MSKGVAIIGGSIGAAKAALTLADLGVEVKIITSALALGLEDTQSTTAISSEEQIGVWPLLLRAANHPLVTLHTNSNVNTITGKQGRFTLRATTKARYVKTNLCTGCGRCAETCSVQIPLLLNGRKVVHSVIHAPVLDTKTTPSAYFIEKQGLAPCRVSCPLGINVQGFVSLLSKGKTDEALSLINESAPLAGVLGRVCTHPCEDGCKRSEVDSPVFIRALHRYAADNAPAGINYTRKAHAGSRKEKIAIIGSGPAGLATAWELARRGYNPTIFEAHAVVGGMLATGVPRFRLPLEVREREVEAIKALGVDIKTGVTVGRDVTLSDLREREYRAFFVAIGAHQNNKLNIPGEDLEGVVDSTSLLFALNLKVGASVGSNVVVIGGGNSAIDSARAAKRRSKGTVRVLYRRTEEEMTAVREEVEDAIREGILIEYLTAPTEILGDGSKVTGIRCQRMTLGEKDTDGRHRPEPIPGSEFTIDADHVVAAIGQRPNLSPFNTRWIEIDEADSTIKVDPLTLETSIPGIFAGGDCVTGPNNVVEAVAAGLRAAESIDRHLRGRDLRKGRTLEKPQTVDFDVNERDIYYHKRASMPAIPPSKRMSSYEETTLGLPDEVSKREAMRCLNCGLCSECKECERVCEVNAVFHNDSAEQVDINAQIIADFTSDNAAIDAYLSNRGITQTTSPQSSRSGIYTVHPTVNYSGLAGELSQADTIALDIFTDLKLKEETYPSVSDTLRELDTRLNQIIPIVGPEKGQEARIGVILCRCGGSISSVIDYTEVSRWALQLPGVSIVQEISQACSEEDARRIAALVAEWELNRVVLAACRCCNIDQVCFSCTDRRMMCRNYLSDSLNTISNRAVEFVNIREQCAWVHEDDPEQAITKAIDIISAGVSRTAAPLPVASEYRPVEGAVFVLGTGLPSLAASKNLIAQGYSVTLVSVPELNEDTNTQSPAYSESKANLVNQLEAQGVHINPWPRLLDLHGSPGNYEIALSYASQASRVKVGALLVDLGEINRQEAAVTTTIPNDSLLGRILARRIGSKPEEYTYQEALRGSAIKDTAGIFIISSDRDEETEEQIQRGATIAARVSAFLHKGTTGPLASAVSVNSKLCRGCGNCATVCSYIEMREHPDGTAYAFIDQALCHGCGACIPHCPTGAATQLAQSDTQIVRTLESLLGKITNAVEAK
ncbi:MAG: FAD-dependent oxidoreductase [Chloroflexota bacterium]|nr:FAD-dependent oxidoreductase [Chloroflexota bacterium]